MICLGIDSSAVTCSVALVSDRTLAERTVTGGPTHSQTLLPFVRDVLEEAGTSLRDVDAVAISAGPGSFTGLRIGISTVKGLCISEKIPVAAVSTLEALAMNCREREGCLICSVMDARRGEFYHALFRIENGFPKRLTPDRAILGQRIAQEIGEEKNVLIVGDGAEKFVDQNPALRPFLAPEELRYQKGESVALIGIREALSENLIPCQKLSPVYLRLPQAEREWLEKNKNK